MAGRKQHYLPQHLLRGFEASKTGKKTQVVVNKKGAPPYATSTEGVAAQRDFYSLPGDGITDTLDDVITAFERSTFNPFLDRARTASPNELVDAESAASAVVHLAVRAAHLRGSFARLARGMVGRFGEILSDTEHVREFAGIDSGKQESLLSEEIQKMLDTLPVAALSVKERVIFEKMVRFRVREKFDAQMPEAAALIRQQLTNFEKALPEVVVRGHTQALEKSLVPVARLDALKRLQWRVIAVESPSHFVLPDCAAIAFSPSGRPQPVALSSNEEISSVAMPVSSKQVLLGYAGQVPPMLSDLNEHFAKCSIDFFVSSTIQPDLEALAVHIGEALEVVTHDLMEDSFSRVRSGREGRNVEAPAVNGRTVPVNFQSDAEKTAAIGASIRQIIAQQCGARELDRLESILVTDDVAREVANLHGRALSPYEVAATMAGTVEHLLGTTPPALRLILSDSIGRLLLDTDVRLKRSAISQVKHLLGRVTYLDYWFGQLVPMTEGRVFTVRQRIALELIPRFASRYHGSVKAAMAADECNMQHDDPLSADTVSTALDALDAARQKFMSHKNVDALMVDAIPALDMLLGTLAGHCGQYPRSTANRQLSQTSPAGEHLVRAGLWDWMDLFGQDLHRHYLSLASESLSVEKLLALSEHVERMLWKFGIFLSDVEDGGMWIDVCDDEQLKLMNRVLNS